MFHRSLGINLSEKCCAISSRLHFALIRVRYGYARLIQNLGEHCRLFCANCISCEGCSLTTTPLPSMPRAPRTPSAASPARSRSCDSRTPRECDRDIVGSYTHRRFRRRPSFQICFACVIRSHHCEVGNVGNCS